MEQGQECKPFIKPSAEKVLNAIRNAEQRIPGGVSEQTWPCLRKRWQRSGLPVDHLYTDPSQWQGITFALVEHFSEWQLGKGYAIASINGRLATIKKYAALACQLRVLPSDELFRIREVKGFRRVEGRRLDLQRSVTRIGEKKAEPTFLMEAQLAALFQVPDLRTPQG